MMLPCHMSPRLTTYPDLASGGLDTEGLVALYGLKQLFSTHTPRQDGSSALLSNEVFHLPVYQVLVWTNSRGGSIVRRPLCAQGLREGEGKERGKNCPK